MSEPTPYFPSTFENDEPEQVWIITPSRRTWLYVLFFFLTLFSTLVVGARMQFNFMHRQPVFSLNDDSLPLFPMGWILLQPSNLRLGIPFSLTLMLILLAHEMGHYLYARHYRVHATLPFFIPFPYSPIGTFGAFIRIKSPIPSRAALFDIGIAGPIAGFIPACGALLVGLSLSRPLVGSEGSYIQLGFPLAFDLAARLLHVGAPLSSLSLHPIAVAAWVGMFATALNLLPCGQLDGGHVVFSVSPRLHRVVSVVTILSLVPLAKFWYGWFLWAFLMTMTARHPPVVPNPSVSGRRRWIALCGLLILILSFMRAPLTEQPHRDLWPDIRDSGQQTLEWLRDNVRHALHRR